MIQSQLKGVEKADQLINQPHCDPEKGSSVNHLYGWNSIPLIHSDDSAQCLQRRRESSAVKKFSIVIPTLNQAETIEDTLKSIVMQDFPEVEIIVIDGGSTDNTLKILGRYEKMITHLISGPDGGQSEAINKGFNLATGDIYAWINSDDYYLPGTFHRVESYFQSNKDIRFAVGAGDVISKEHSFLRHIPAIEINQFAISNWKNDRWIMQQSCFWSQSLWKEVGGVDCSLKLLMDVDLWFRFSKITSCYVIPEKLAVMRYYKNAKTVRYRNTSLQEMAYVYAKCNATDCVRDLVTQLVREQATQTQRMEELNSRLPVRLLKRMRLLPR